MTERASCVHVRRQFRPGKSVPPITGEECLRHLSRTVFGTQPRHTRQRQKVFFSRVSLSRQRLKVSAAHSSLMYTMPSRDNLPGGLPFGTPELPKTQALMDGATTLKCRRTPRLHGRAPKCPTTRSLGKHTSNVCRRASITPLKSPVSPLPSQTESSRPHP